MKRLIGIFLMFAFGCQAQHDYMIYTPNKARVQNLTGQKISLAVCSNYTDFSTEKLGRSMIDVSANGTSEVTLIWDTRHEIKYDASGGFDYQYSDQVKYIHFTLDAASFRLAKLCLMPETVTHVIVNKNAPCPALSWEQLSPTSCY